jgi:uncharacterized protein (DUF433 family)
MVIEYSHNIYGENVKFESSDYSKILDLDTINKIKKIFDERWPEIENNIINYIAKKKQAIFSTEDIFGGDPIIKGTRILVSYVGNMSEDTLFMTDAPEIAAEYDIEDIEVIVTSLIFYKSNKKLYNIMYENKPWFTNLMVKL